MVLRKKKTVSVASQMAWKLTLLFTFTMTVVHVLGIIPDPKQAARRHKAALNENLAVSASLLKQYSGEPAVEKYLAAIVARHPDVLSACVRRADGTVLQQIGEHDRYWRLPPGAPSTDENTYVPIISGKSQWGVVEVAFARQRGLWAVIANYPILPIAGITVLLNGVMVRWYLRRAFKYLDPTRSVPAHVRSTLDTFSEGVVVFDNDRRIVLANERFKQQLDKSDQELLGEPIESLPWDDEDGEYTPSLWQVGDRAAVEGMRLGLQVGTQRRIYFVNASPILGADGRRRGTIASFDDITPLEQKREELSQMLVELKSSRDELSVRNKELQYLATRDPLTGCLNRRTFFEVFDRAWHDAQRRHAPLSCFMVDVDHFKSVNDNYGHSMGDEVLRGVAATLMGTARETDVVCRYGGEEFCIVLPATDAGDAVESAERMRRAIERLEFDELRVTASLGVSALGMGAADPQELLDQADKCLYVAKRNGRNQVVRWDDVPEDVELEASPRREEPVSEDEISIPYPAVASLLSALAYRDADTAAHSTRVAELCVATASGLLSVKETYVLEVAALLHDIGKIGVPDAILLKPGPLTREEWETMELHDRIGVEIVEASFSNKALIEIVRYHHAMYGGNPATPHFPEGDQIPVGARIVSIADAYDAMVSDRVYRKGRPPEEAFAELRRCAGRQFDPELVERFIEVIQGHEPQHLPVASKQLALQVGLQIERLAQAVDDQDSAGIKALSARLETTAARGGIHEIQKVAASIRQVADEDGDLVRLLQMVNELLALCRSAQKAYASTDLNVPPRVIG